MNDNDRQRLTEWLGEQLCADDSRYISPCEPDDCLHIESGGTWDDCKSKHIRTFATPSDMMACKDRLVELGIIEHFDAFIYIKWHEWFEGDDGRYIYFWEWLMEPERFCQLVADFLKEGE